MKTIFSTLIFLSVSIMLFAQEDGFVTDIAYIQEVVVKSNSTQVSLDLNSVNILDYRVYGSDILTLKKMKRNYFIGIEYADKEAENYLLNIKKPRFIYSDCMNNVFVLNDQNAYQFVIVENEIKIISVLSLNEFNANVRSCVSNFDDAILVREYTDFNKGYELKLYSKDTAEVQTVFKMLDMVSLNNYLEISNGDNRRNTYNSQTRRIRQAQFIYRDANTRTYSFREEPLDGFIRYGDPITRFIYPVSHGPRSVRANHNGLSNPYFFNDPFYRSISDTRRTFYLMLLKNMYSKKVQVETFELGDGFVVVDKVNSTVSTFTKEGKLKAKLMLKFDSEVIEMKQDPYTNEIYFTSKTENLFKVHRLNIEDGTTHYVGGFKNIMLAKSIKIFNGWIYYRVMKNDYYKLYRTKLRS